MTRGKLRSRIDHIIDAIDHIDMLVGDRGFEEFHSNRIGWAAYERFLEIVSEASRHITPGLKASSSQIPWRKIADIGNHLRHVYEDLDQTVLWEIHASGQLAKLRTAVIGFVDVVQEGSDSKTD